MNEVLKLLRDYFPTAVYTGTSLVFISEESRVELTQRPGSMATEGVVSVVRVKLFSKDEMGEFVPGHFEDFCIPDISDLAGEIEKFVQFAVGKNLRE